MSSESVHPSDNWDYGTHLYSTMTKTLTVRKFLDSSTALAYTNTCLMSEHAITQLFPHTTVSQPTIGLSCSDHRHTFFYQLVGSKDIADEVSDELDIYMTEVQCHNLMVKPGDRVQYSLEPVRFPEAASVTFSVSLLQKDPAMESEIKLNGPDIDEVVKKTFLSHIVTEGQAIAVGACNQRLQLIVSTYDAPIPVESDDESEEEVLMRENMFPEERQSPFAVIGSKTNIEYRSTTFIRVSSPFRVMDILKKGLTSNQLGIPGTTGQMGCIFSHLVHPRLIAEREGHSGKRFVKGALFYGPPGMDKTLLARSIRKMLQTRREKIISGSEIVGRSPEESEENIRVLFEDAEKDSRDRGSEADLHLIIIQELDAICPGYNRGGGEIRYDNTVVLQLIRKMDSLENIIVIGITSRPWAIDRTLLLSGRLEVPVEFLLPDEQCRLDVLLHHTDIMNRAGHLDIEAELSLRSIVSMTHTYTCGELERVVRSALLRAVRRHLVRVHSVNAMTRAQTDSSLSQSEIVETEEKEWAVTRQDLEDAVGEVAPQFGAIWRVFER